MADVDTLRRFVFERYPFRGQLVHLGPAWKAMMEHHDYPAEVRDTLGEAVAAAALLASTLKFQGLLTLQLRGEGPMHLMLVECTDGLAMRAVARFREPPATRDLRELSGDGTLTVTIDNEGSANRYQGVVPLVGRLDERLPARILRELRAAADAAVAARRWRQRQRPAAAAAAGDVEAGRRGRVRRRRACRKTRSRMPGAACSWWPTPSPAQELVELDDQKLLRRLFAEDDVRMFESSPVFFRCRCSRERVEDMLRALGRAEVDSMVEEFGQVEVRCEFCSRAYRLDAVDCAALFSGPGATPSGVH